MWCVPESERGQRVPTGWVGAWSVGLDSASINKQACHRQVQPSEKMNRFKKNFFFPSRIKPDNEKFPRVSQMLNVLQLQSTQTRWGVFGFLQQGAFYNACMKDS